MNRQTMRLAMLAVLVLNSGPLLAQQQAATLSATLPDPAAINSTSPATGDPAGGPSADGPSPAAGKPHAESANAGTQAASSAPHLLGPLDFTVNWRFRTEAWDWFQPPTGQNAYAFEHSLLEIGIGQRKESFEWVLQGATDAILNLPTGAVLAAPQGQLGLGGAYFAANGSQSNKVNGFLKLAYVGFRLPAKGSLKLGRFTFLDGTEVTPKDKTLATLVNTRVSQRLIGDFGFSAVQRSFDGAQVGFNAGNNNITLLGVRPTQGVYQSGGMGELNIELFYGAFTHSTHSRKTAGSLRVFALGYIDGRTGVLKTDNRPSAVRAGDTDPLHIGTYGADYAQVISTDHAGQFDFLAWGALQNGAWGTLAQRAGTFVGEAGWLPPVRAIKPWFSAGYSFGSGDSNPNDNVHGTFFQVLPTPRPYDRFPFYNMMNNEDFYGSAAFRLPRSVAIRSELHALRLADARDLWYVGGGAFQPNTFGYTGRSSGGARSLANVSDVSLDVPLGHGFSITTYYAHAWGKNVIAGIYPGGTNGQYGYVETNYRF